MQLLIVMCFRVHALLLVLTGGCQYRSQKHCRVKASHYWRCPMHMLIFA